jgi:NAD(P)-dependent dehydrogenase (short-subunit alcohol dehydrogenase family)
MNEQEFTGKTVLVTGAASGIGFATAREFTSLGANVVIVDRNEKAANDAKKKIESEMSGAKLFVSLCDVSSETDVTASVRQTVKKFGALDIVVNNAGMMVFKPLDQHTMEDWDKVLNVDLLGAFFFIKEAFGVMKPGSAIVNVSSVHAVETTPNVAAYAAAKAALVSLTHSASIEGKPKGIRANCVLPGAVDTPMLWNNPNIKNGLEVINQSDVGKPEEIASAIAFLASPAASFIQGAAVRVDGGRLSHL